MRVHKIIGTIAAAGLALALATPVRAAQDENTQRGQLSEKDYKFLADAARGGMEEVQLGQLAQEKGVNQAVRSFGERMVTDHTKANNELKQIAAQKGATLPATMSHGERSTFQHLQNESGADFDKTYAKDMVKDHKKDVKEFEKAAKDLTDPDLKHWAQKTLPTLQDHLSQAEQLENQIKNEK
jgi:putative membrane protein